MNRHRNLSFYIETLVLLLFLLAALTVLLRVFGTAQQMGRQARQKTDAALILQTVSAQFSAQENPFDEAIRKTIAEGEAQVEFLCDAEGVCVKDGKYRVSADLRAQQTAEGNLVYADIRVSAVSSDRDDAALAELETSRYCPQYREEAQS